MVREYIIRLPSKVHRDECLPEWHLESVTNRQIKLLKFFGKDTQQRWNKGSASAYITKLLHDPQKKHLWFAYCLTTGDFDDSTELQPYNLESLRTVKLPESWTRSPFRETPEVESKYVAMISQIMNEGSPFDDPVPEIKLGGTTFCLTGTFDFGTRDACILALEEHGAIVHKSVKRDTQVLIIGNEIQPRWKHHRFGNKIVDAFGFRESGSKIKIISELYMKELLSTSPKSDRICESKKECLETLLLLSKGTASPNIPLLKPFDDISNDWFMCVPPYFNDALAIKQVSRVASESLVWSQGATFSFEAGSVLYDSIKGYESWDIALQSCQHCFQITRATPMLSAQGSENKSLGSVGFDVFKVRNGKLQKTGSYTVTQVDFIFLLINKRHLSELEQYGALSNVGSVW